MKRARESGVSVAALLVVGIFSFVGAWHLGWTAAGSHTTRPVDERTPRGFGEQAQLLACAVVRSLPACPPRMSIVTQPANGQGQTYRELFASLPDLAAALEQLRWNRGDGAEAVRLMSVIKSLELGRYRQNRRSAHGRLKELVTETWRDHPELVTASSCTHCGDIPGMARAQMDANPPAAEWAVRFASGHPRNLTLLGNKGYLTTDQILELAVVHAELFSPGRSSTSQYVANVLIENQRYDSLLAWVTKGLNGSAALEGVGDLSELPPAIVAGAWERGVFIGNHPIRLTDYLVQQGYRPALRWLIWMLDGSAKYITANQARYEDIFRRTVHLPSHPGMSLSQFYSAYWRDIHWDPETGTWRI